MSAKGKSSRKDIHPSMLPARSPRGPRNFFELSQSFSAVFWADPNASWVFFCAVSAFELAKREYWVGRRRERAACLKADVETADRILSVSEQVEVNY
jgi:hypothetical protein